MFRKWEGKKSARLTTPAPSCLRKGREKSLCLTKKKKGTKKWQEVKFQW
jgi:hypothetical protein